jgi:pimeloyl-ACP methyl ester carboxylesterase
MGQPDVLFTAFLSTPAIAAGLAGALAMSPVLPPVSGATIAEALARPAVVAGVDTGTPQPFIGPDPVGGGSSLDTIARLDGVALLDQLIRLSSSERSEFLQQHPEAILDLSTTPPAAASVSGWWSRTSGSSRAGLISDLPGVVGNLEGLPYAVRDGANRAFLSATVFDIRAQLEAGVGRAMEDELRARLRMLGSVEEALRTGASGEKRTLVSLDVTGQGRAVVAVGDLSAADYVTFFVPGMYVGVSEQLVDWTGNAETSLLEQQQWLDRLGLEASAATVAWIGYQTPTIVNISSFDLAYQGRDALTWSLEGLDAVRGGVADATRPFVSIVAHSYGSTAAMLALQENDVSVDALVLVGSPGSPATSVDDLKVTGGNVWVAAADSDPIPRSGVFGSQPLDADFGAHRFSVRGMSDPITGEKLAEISGHVYYFWPGTTSVRNTALIAIGQGVLVATDAGLARSSSR